MIRRKSPRLSALRYLRARRGERKYTSQLTKLAAHIGDLIAGMAPYGVVKNVPTLTTALHNYAQLIKPWATSVAGAMVADVDRRDYETWNEVSGEIGSTLRRELKSTPVGSTLRKQLNDSVELITSLPVEAAERVHKLTVEALVTGRRAEDIAKEIMRSGEVTKARAKLIARTEVSRTATELTKARAKHMGSEGYIWRTVGDSDVRHAHAQMEGKFVPWDREPTLSDGTKTHAGMIYNCRCYPEPILPNFDLDY